MFLKNIRYCLLLLLLSGGCEAYAQDDKTSKQLSALKQQDNLTEWLYVRIDYVNANSQQQEFLLATQKQAWRQPKTTNEQVAWLTLLSNQGYNQLQTGDILQSINSYEDAYTYFRRYKVVQFDVVEYVLKPLGNNYTRLGDYERAIYIQQKTISSLNEKDDADNLASIYSNMAISYYNMGQYAAAEQSVSKGAKLVKDAQVKFSLNNTLADILVQKNELKSAEILLRKNIATQKKADKQTAYGLMGSYTTLGNIHLQTKQLSTAAGEFNKALNLIDTYYPNDRLREKAYLIAMLGKIDRLQNKPQAALIKFDKALNMLRINTDQTVANIYGENKLVEIFHEKALTYIALDKTEPALQNMRYALLATDKIRTEFDDDKTKERLQNESKDMAETAMSLAFDIAKARLYDKELLIPLLEICEQSRARTLADQVSKNAKQFNANNKDPWADRKRAIERTIVYNQKMMMTEKDTAMYQKKIAALKFDLALLNKQQRKENIGQVLPAEALLKALPDSMHVFEYFLGNKDLYIIHIVNHKVEQVTKIGNVNIIRDKVNQLVNKYYRAGPDAMLASPKDFYNLSYDVFEDLILTTNVSLKNNERICIVPDDVLGYLSFDGLITNRNYEPAISRWQFLIRKATVTYAFSLNTLIKNKNSATAAGGFSGLFATHDKVNDKPIEAVKNEAAAIKKLVKGNYVYDDDVNSKAFFNAFSNSSVLHISTHAYLSGTDKEPTLDFGKDKLYLFELLGKANKPDLVVLSACQTGDGLLAKGEGIISLSRGFSAVGTPATVAGLWNVNDDAVAQITANMYAGLTNGQSSGRALHNAKLRWLNNPQASDAMYLPYYWDSLVLMGADKTVALEKANHWRPVVVMVLALAIIIALIAAVIWRRKRQ